MQVFQIQVQSKYFILNQLQIRHTYSFKIQFILFKPKITSIVFFKRQNNPSTVFALLGKTDTTKTTTWKQIPVI